MSQEDARTEVIDRMRGLFLPPRDMPESMEQRALSEYVDALKGYSKAALERAWQTVRNGHKTRSWPTIGQFVAAAGEASRDVRTRDTSRVVHAESGRETENGWQPWAGCQCDSCTFKTRRDGFFQAPKSDHAREQALRTDLDFWMKRGPSALGELALMVCVLGTA